jgi:hypothetical protein
MLHTNEKNHVHMSKVGKGSHQAALSPTRAVHVNGPPDSTLADPDACFADPDRPDTFKPPSGHAKTHPDMFLGITEHGRFL